MKGSNKKLLALAAMAVFTIIFANAEDLNFYDWHSWGGVRALARGNTVTLNGSINLAGYVTESLVTALRNRTITLEIDNAGASFFGEGRMFKITVNHNDLLIWPHNVDYLIHDEYIPSNYDRVEFTLPADFDGKLGLVFYQADLKDLQITATYR